MKTIRFRRATAAEATASNPVLDSGEPGFETDTGRFKVGDGVTAWNDLPYVVNSATTHTIVELTQAEYDALTPVAGTLYVVVPA